MKDNFFRAWELIIAAIIGGWIGKYIDIITSSDNNPAGWFMIIVFSIIMLVFLFVLYTIYDWAKNKRKT